MKKRLCSLILCLTLLAGCFSLPAAHADVPSALPAIGEVIHGFEVTSLGAFDLVGAPAALLTHQKTGALVYYIQSADINRAMSITFRTPAMDNTGVPHVFEHLTLSGSKKYPSQNFFFPMSNQTYNTFINAMTGQTYTVYPFSSLSDDQLYTLADIYLDGVFNPLLYEEPRLFDREAWRYELADKDAPITLTGIVYSEMKGASTLSQVSRLNTMRTLYPGSVAGNNAGGSPSDIPNLTYQALLDFHGAYYHPSNAFVTLYGDLDLTRFLELMDRDYFSAYDKKEIFIETGAIDPLTQPVEASFVFPVEQDSTTDNTSELMYAFAANGADLQDNHLFNLLTSILAHESSPLVHAMKDALPHITFGSYVSLETPVPTIVFQGIGANPEDAATFQQTVDTAMASILVNGLDKSFVDAVLAAYKFSVLMVPEASNISWQIATIAGTEWAQFDDPQQQNALLAMVDDHLTHSDASVYVDAMARFLNDNPHRALVITQPEAGLAEKESAALATSLAEYKASLTDVEIDALVQGTLDQAAFSTEAPPPEMLAKLQVVHIDTLPEEIDHYAVNDRMTDGVRILTSQVQTNAIGRTGIELSTKHVPVEDLHYLVLLASLSGSLNTKTHEKAEITTQKTRYLNNFSLAASVVELPEKTYEPVLRADWVSMNEDLALSLALIREILFETEFTDVAEIKTQVSTLKNHIHMWVQQNPLSIQFMRILAVYTPENAYMNYIDSLNLYAGLSEIEALLNTDPDAVCNKLSEIQQSLANKSGAVARFAGNEEGTALFDETIQSFFEGMSSDAPKAADYSALPIPAMREALLSDSQVQFNMRYIPLEGAGLEEENGTFAPLSLLIDDMYLTPRLRLAIGAYGAYSFMDRDGIGVYSYRDPAVSESFAVFDGLPEFLKTLQIEQADLDRYIISAYSNLAMPVGQLSGATTAIFRTIAGRDQDEKLTRMREMKTFSPETIQNAVPYFEQLIQQGALSTAGSAQAIEENKGLYDAVVKME